MTIITVDTVTFSYPYSDAVLKDVSFAVTKGEFIGIIGPNGGGKTTLLKLIMGFLSPQKGTIRVNNMAPSTHPNSIAYVPQMIKFDRSFPITLFELVLCGRAHHLSSWGLYSQQDKEICAQALELVGLASMQKMSFSSLSGGQLQRALIARALASEPNILLLDEPTAHIDNGAERSILDLLYKLKHDLNLSILMVTHDLSIMVEKVDRFLCVQGSVTSTSPGEICEHFALGLYHHPLAQVPHNHLKGNP